MADDKRVNRLEKTLIYKRAYWDKGSRQILSEILINAHNNKSTVGDRIFPYENGQIQGSTVNINKENQNIELHITYYIDESKASALNKNTSEQKNLPSEAPPPKGI